MQVEVKNLYVNAVIGVRLVLAVQGKQFSVCVCVRNPRAGKQTQTDRQEWAPGRVAKQLIRARCPERLSIIPATQMRDDAGSSTCARATTSRDDAAVDEWMMLRCLMR